MAESQQRITTGLSELKALAGEEGVAWSSKSEAQLRSFLVEAGATAVPCFYVRETGNLRSVWFAPNREQVGLQFFEDGSIQYVIFKQRETLLAKATGVDTVEGVLELISSLGVLSLLYA